MLFVRGRGGAGQRSRRGDWREDFWEDDLQGRVRLKEGLEGSERALWHPNYECSILK